MADRKMLEAFLASAHGDEEVFALPPDHRVMLPAAGALIPGPSNEASEALLTDDTTVALFILGAPVPMTDDALRAATNDLAAHLAQLGPDVCVARRVTVTDRTSQGRDGA